MHIDIRRFHFDQNIARDFDTVGINMVFDRFHNVYRCNSSNNCIDICHFHVDIVHDSNKDSSHMDRSFLHNIDRKNISNTDKRTYLVRRDMFHCWNMVDWNNDRNWLNNLCRWNWVDNNIDSQWHSSRNKYHHFDKDNRNSIEDDDQYNWWNLKERFFIRWIQVVRRILTRRTMTVGNRLVMQTGKISI